MKLLNKFAAWVAASTLALVAFVTPAHATTGTYDSLTAAVDFSEGGPAVLAVAAAIIALLVIIRVAGIIQRRVGKG